MGPTFNFVTLKQMHFEKRKNVDLLEAASARFTGTLAPIRFFFLFVNGFLFVNDGYV